MPDMGRLVLAGTPIGDAKYVHEALRSALREAQVVAAEDTRKFLDLCRRAEVPPPGRIVSYFEGNEATRTPQLVEVMEAGGTVVLVTDAGMPSISDPGYRLVIACIDAGIQVSAIPGPSAGLAALVVSGLATDRFCFEGFLPRKSGPRKARLEALRTEDRTMIFFEAPHRLHEFLSDAAHIFGQNRRASVCRELTKTYEEIVRGSLSELVTWAEAEVRGEITVVVAGYRPGSATMEELVVLVRELLAAGAKKSAAVAQVAARYGADRGELYNAVLKR
jgi:16S rRNA (cytidine1402-2'-O)-methyltransferase